MTRIKDYIHITKNTHRIFVRLMLCTIAFSTPCHAQKKDIQTAKDQVKAGKDLDKAQKSMEKLLGDSANRSNKKIWAVLYDAVRKQYEQGNEQLYLKQKYDTAKLFNVTRRLFEIAGELDSVEMCPDKKGRVELEYRKPHAEFLGQIRPNLYNGGAWFIRKKDYAEAYRFFDRYIKCASMPMFRDFHYQQQDKRLPVAAYWAVYCGYKMKDAQATLHHSYEALKDTAHYDYMLQYLAETYKLEKDTARYVQTLRDGFDHSPKFPFFFPRLVEYYAEESMLDSAMNIVNHALANDPDSELYLYTKSTLLLSQGKNRESLSISEALLQRNDTLTESYYNAGLANFNMAVVLDKSNQLSRKQHSEVTAYYQKALPYLERYRKMAPQEKAKWAFPLYTIYLNLNKGTEFDEIDAIVREINKSRKQ